MRGSSVSSRWLCEPASRSNTSPVSTLLIGRLREGERGWPGAVSSSWYCVTRQANAGRRK